MGISYRRIGIEDLDAGLIAAWRGIQSADKTFSSPFFCPEFTQLVGRVRRDVRIVVIEDNGRPVGFFPYQLGLWGLGKPVAGPLSDFHGVIADAESEWQTEPLMRAARLILWSFDHLVGSSGQFKRYISQQSVSPRIDLALGYNDYVRRRRDSDYITKTEGLARKLAREVGELSFTFHESNNEAVDRLISWKSEQYLRTGLNDAFSVSWTRELLFRVVAVQTAQFAGACSVLRAGDKTVAIHAGMHSQHAFHYWFPAYDRQFAKYSPGIILLLRMARAASELGIKTLDLGKGVSQYKQRLMTSSVSLHEGAVELPSLITVARRLYQSAEVRSRSGVLAPVLRLPVAACRRVIHSTKFR